MCVLGNVVVPKAWPNSTGHPGLSVLWPLSQPYKRTTDVRPSAFRPQCCWLILEEGRGEKAGVCIVGTLGLWVVLGPKHAPCSPEKPGNLEETPAFCSHYPNSLARLQRACWPPFQPPQTSSSPPAQLPWPEHAVLGFQATERRNVCVGGGRRGGTGPFRKRD